MITKQISSGLEDQMKKTLERMRSEFGSLRTGRVSGALLEGVRVEYYGSVVPLNQVANIATLPGRTLEIKPWDKSLIGDIEKAILKSDLGLTPSNDGHVIRLGVPLLSEERRKELTKVIRKMTEDYRVAVRNSRRDAVEKLKKAEKSREISEDERAVGEHEIQKITDLYIHKIDELLATKEKEILEV